MVQLTVETAHGDKKVIQAGQYSEAFERATEMGAVFAADDKGERFVCLCGEWTALTKGAVRQLQRPLALEQQCRVCGCTDDDCTQCIQAQGYPCYWVEEDLCSRCAGRMER